MGILSWVIVGGIVGVFSSIITKRRGFRMLTVVLVSIVGAVLGGMDVAFLFRVPGALMNLNWNGMLVAFAGALVAIALLHLLTPQKSPAV